MNHLATLIEKIPLNLESQKGYKNAEEKTRTSTPLRTHDPESCASTNSATSALVIYSGLIMSCPLTNFKMIVS